MGTDRAVDHGVQVSVHVAESGLVAFVACYRHRLPNPFLSSERHCSAGHTELAPANDAQPQKAIDPRRWCHLGAIAGVRRQPGPQRRLTTCPRCRKRAVAATDASPPGTWTLDQGVDIAGPGGTPLLAVGSGTIVLHGIGGFGPSAPVLHLDSGPYVYYGHAGTGGWIPVGTHVSTGQVISEVGSGIVGISTGPHLEIGFADSSGSPIGSQFAVKMMSLLKASHLR
jgi:murein DD-endopeptidase MepM/ murein hydrolase activator NlpD